MLGTGFIFHPYKIPGRQLPLVVSLYRPGNKGHNGEVICAFDQSFSQLV